MNEKILVVDDEKEIADLLEVYLMLVKYQNRIMALPMLCMIIIVLSACCFDEQKNETSNVNPKVQSVETVSVTRGNLTPTVSAHTTIIPALDFVL